MVARSLEIRFKKASDGRASLAGIRGDGTTTWQRDRTGGFFPVHDLTHYAVETTLGLDRAFFGLLSEGWNITDFGPPWPHGALPHEALLAELIVGLLDLESASGHRLAAAEMNQALRQKLQAAGAAPASRDLTQAELDTIRATRARLIARWRAVTPGDTLVLRFPAGS
jgi:hypothetical protein